MGQTEVKRYKVGGTFESAFEQVVEAGSEEEALRKILAHGPDPNKSIVLHPIMVEFIAAEE